MIIIGTEDSPVKEQYNVTEDRIAMRCSIDGKAETHNDDSIQVSSFFRNRSIE